MKKYLVKNGSSQEDEAWFNPGTIARLIDDYRGKMDAGLFIGYRNGLIDEEVCNFDEFEEIEVEEMDTELDKEFDVRDEWWKKVKKS